jgi:hypothetical protein
VIPLIGPLEDGLLLVPALVSGKGPFVFAIDPDAHVSIIDEEVLAAVKPATGEGPRMLDESDTEQNRFYAEILKWQLGTLTVDGPKPAQIVGKGTFDADGRRIHGVIGRDIIAASLVFGFDRDTGVVTLQTQKTFKAPASAAAIKYEDFKSDVMNADVVPAPRRLVHAQVNGATFALHADFGATASQLRARSWSKGQLVETDTDGRVVDEAGMLRPVKKLGTAAMVSLGSVSSSQVGFVYYADKRWSDRYIEGTLGLGFFWPFAVIASWDTQTLFLTPRRAQANELATRLARWQSPALTACKLPGCATVTLTDPLANKPEAERAAQHPGVVLSVARDPATADLSLEVLVASTSADGKPLHWLVANLPPGAQRALTHLNASYVGATFQIIDVGLFPRSCPSEGACIDLLKSPRPISAGK